VRNSQGCKLPVHAEEEVHCVDMSLLDGADEGRDNVVWLAGIRSFADCLATRSIEAPVVVIAKWIVDKKTGKSMGIMSEDN